jgi:hypothetical protein
MVFPLSNEDRQSGLGLASIENMGKDDMGKNKKGESNGTPFSALDATFGKGQLAACKPAG